MKAKSIALWVIAALIALLMVFAGSKKLTDPAMARTTLVPLTAVNPGCGPSIQNFRVI